jgi:hypothetical protein
LSGARQDSVDVVWRLVRFRQSGGYLLPFRRLLL